MAWKNPFRRWKSASRSDAALTPTKAAILARHDAFANVITNLGMPGRDKRMGARAYVAPVSDQEAQILWRGDDTAKKIIEWLPKASQHRGFVPKFPTKMMSEDVSAELEDLNAIRDFIKAGQYERAYGGGALFPIMNDGKNPGEELSPGVFPEVRGIITFEPRELRPVAWQTDLSTGFGTPLIYQVYAAGSGFSVPTGLLIHASRLIIFPGIRVGREQPAGTSLGFGDSNLTLVNRVLADFNMGFDGLSALLAVASQAIFKMAGLAQLAATDQDDTIFNRMTNIDLMRSIVNAFVVDKDDEFEIASVDLSGHPAALESLMVRVSAAADMSAVRLYGIAPQGMNATGESDISQDDDRISTYQQDSMPQLQKLVRMVAMGNVKGLRGKEPPRWSIEYNPLRQPTAKEKAETNYIIAQIDDLNIGNKIYSAEDAAKSHYGGDTYSPDIVIDWKNRESQIAAESELAAGEAQTAALVAGSTAKGLPAKSSAAEDPTLDARGDADANSVYIALAIPLAAAKRLAVRDGLKPAEMHITLAYLGKELTETQRDAVLEVARQVADSEWPVPVSLGPVRRFAASISSDGMDVIYRAVSSPALNNDGGMRGILIAALAARGLAPATEHEYTPHITMAYVPQGDAAAEMMAAPKPDDLVCEALYVGIGDQTFRYPFAKE